MVSLLTQTRARPSSARSSTLSLLHWLMLTDKDLLSIGIIDDICLRSLIKLIRLKMRLDLINDADFTNRSSITDKFLESFNIQSNSESGAILSLFCFKVTGLTSNLISEPIEGVELPKA